MFPHLGEGQMPLHVQQFVLQEKNPKIMKLGVYTGTQEDMTYFPSLTAERERERESELIIYSGMQYHEGRGEGL